MNVMSEIETHKAHLDPMCMECVKEGELQERSCMLTEEASRA
jgi:hypothetical protein